MLSWEGNQRYFPNFGPDQNNVLLCAVEVDRAVIEDSVNFEGCCRFICLLSRCRNCVLRDWLVQILMLGGKGSMVSLSEEIWLEAKLILSEISVNLFISPPFFF